MFACSMPKHARLLPNINYIIEFLVTIALYLVTNNADPGHKRVFATVHNARRASFDVEQLQM